MIVYKNKPKNSWISPYEIVDKLIFWREVDYDEPIVDFWANVLTPFCNVLYSVRKFFERDINYVKIDPWDAWSVDSTLSPIIAPLLKQLKKAKHGAPFVEDEDVPANLRHKKSKGKTSSKHQDIHAIDQDHDPIFFKRWDYILDEMIWTFEQLSDWDHDGKFYDHRESRKEKDLNKSVRKIKVDKVGLKKHWARIDNGLRLFGKYYRALWD
jgi:hypothetical protein